MHIGLEVDMAAICQKHLISISQKSIHISWLTSSRSFVVSITSTSSATTPLRQGSVLGPPLFILYILLSVFLSLIRLSVIIYLLLTLNCSSPSEQRNSPPVFNTYNTIDLVSKWMSANLLSLNYSKTEFLLIGLPAQLSKSLILLF